jgi:hypothetical protein
LNIRYVGFQVRASSRAYSFLVTNAPNASRQFTVTIQFTAFRPTQLKFQDGPDICFTRLRQELEREIEGSLASAQLQIADEDVQKYLEKHQPRKRF